MFELLVTKHFDAAHCLKDYKGNCSSLHGHRWVINTRIAGDSLDHKNMLVDFKAVKEVVDLLLPDHRYLNDYFDEDNPTAEYIARHLYNNLKQKFPGLLSVEVFESPDCSVTYHD